MTTLSYPTDLTNDQWGLIADLLPQASKLGRRRSICLRRVLNAIFYVSDTGCKWRMLPHDYPNWHTVYTYFRRWRIDGTWERINDQLRQWVRVVEERSPTPSMALLDSQSVKTGLPGAEQISVDGGKLVNGRKRHFLVDTIGLLLMVVVTAAGISDQQGARQVFERLGHKQQKFPRLVRILADGTYRGEAFMRWVMDGFRWILEVVLRSDEVKGFVVQPKRWVVERSFGWLLWSRRLSKDYERLPQMSEAFIYVAMIRIMLKRLA
jgi:transposase